MNTVRIRWLGRRPYVPVWQAMQRFTAARTPATEDEIWLLEHEPVYTVGVRGESEPCRIGGIPVVATDRGGLITYHGPGQLIAYPLLDLSRLNLSVRDLVTALEASVIAVLRQYGIAAQARRDAPGVYVGDAKIASLGIRVRRFRSYHGLALNVDLDLAPFHRIDPCGFRGLAMTRLADLGVGAGVHEVAVPLLGALLERLGLETVTDRLTCLPEEERRHERPA